MKLKKLLRQPVLADIRFWILIFFVVRLYHITQPPLEIAHNWRQCTCLMVSRNFYEIDANILYPRLDMAREKSGITGTEFPLFNYLIYTFAKLFGWNDWYGRLINLIVSSIGVYWFYRLISVYFNRRHAFYATLILLNSIWFAYSRKTMPDTFSISLVIGGFLFAVQYLRSREVKHLFWFFVLILCGLLSKIPSGLVIVPLVFLFLSHHIQLRPKIILALLFIIIMVPVICWYFIWVPYLVKEYQFFHYYMGTTIITGYKELSGHMDKVFERFYFSALNFIGFSVFVAGIVLAILRKQKMILWTLSLSVVAIFFYILKAGHAFYAHNYYIMPFVPVMAFVAGYALSEIRMPAVRNIIVLAIAIEVIINALPEFRINKDQEYKQTLEGMVAKYTEPNDLIAINCGFNPQEFYLAHRKGWPLENENEIKKPFFDVMRYLGCKVVVMDKHMPLYVVLPYKKLEENEDFVLYEL